MVMNKHFNRATDIITSLKNDCYPPCLQLKDTDGGEYLDTRIEQKNGKLSIKHWNKNEDAILRTGKQRYLKHQHHYSYNSPQAKKGALIGTWTRIDNSTMENVDLLEAVQTKIKELKTLKFPLKKVIGTLTHMHKKNG